jgi:transcriptional regulator GlxA family with amidase domain
MVVPPQRDGGQAQFILRPLPEAAGLSLAPVTDWMLENLRMELTVDQLAAKAHMSPRTFARRFKADHGTTPAAWLGRQRIIQAQRLLEQTDLGLDRIAYECGFGSASVLRQNFSRMLGTTPTAYRATFCCILTAQTDAAAEASILEPVA